jgi:hypothetical protein
MGTAVFFGCWLLEKRRFFERKKPEVSLAVALILVIACIPLSWYARLLRLRAELKFEPQNQTSIDVRD